MGYQASIKNVTRGTWLLKENYGLVKHTKKADKRLIFFDEYDAESVLAMLEDCSSDCYVLCVE